MRAKISAAMTVDTGSLSCVSVNTGMSGELLGQDIVYYIGGRQAADRQGGLVYKLTRSEDAVYVLVEYGRKKCVEYTCCWCWSRP